MYGLFMTKQKMIQQAISELLRTSLWKRGSAKLFTMRFKATRKCPLLLTPFLWALPYFSDFFYQLLPGTAIESPRHLLVD